MRLGSGPNANPPARPSPRYLSRHVHEEHSSNGCLSLAVALLRAVQRVGLQHTEQVLLAMKRTSKIGRQKLTTVHHLPCIPMNVYRPALEPALPGKRCTCGGQSLNSDPVTRFKHKARMDQGWMPDRERLRRGWRRRPCWVLAVFLSLPNTSLCSCLCPPTSLSPFPPHQEGLTRKVLTV